MTSRRVRWVLPEVEARHPEVPVPPAGRSSGAVGRRGASTTSGRRVSSVIAVVLMLAASFFAVFDLYLLLVGIPR